VIGLELPLAVTCECGIRHEVKTAHRERYRDRDVKWLVMICSSCAARVWTYNAAAIGDTEVVLDRTKCPDGLTRPHLHTMLAETVLV
jgi:hypothetical protein